MSPNKINTALQFLPISGCANPYSAVDHVITIIDASGLPYRVCPFETVVEGTSSECLGLIKSILEYDYQEDVTEFLLNIKFHVIPGKDVRIADKTKKYEV